MNTNHRRSFYVSLPTNSLRDILLQVKFDTQNLHTITTKTNRPPPIKLRMRLVYASVCLFHNQTRAQVSVLRARKMISVSYKGNYSRVSFCDGSFYVDSLLRPLSSRTEHSRLEVHQCRNSSVLSVPNALNSSFSMCMCLIFLYFSAVLLSLL